MTDALWGDIGGYSPLPHFLVRHLKEYEISDREFRLICTVLQYRNSKSRTCFPKNKTIAEQMDSSLSTVHRLARSLSDKGYLVRRRIGRSKWEWDFSRLATMVKLRHIGRSCHVTAMTPHDMSSGDTPQVIKKKRKRNKKQKDLRSFAKERQTPTTPLKSTASRSSTGFTSIGDVMGEITSSIGEGNAK